MSSTREPPDGDRSPSRSSAGSERLFAWLRGLGLRRDTSNRWVAGVCSGVAERFGVDPLVVRAVTLVLVLFGGLGVALYALAWAFLPDRDGLVRAEEALHGDASSIVLLVVVGLVVLGQLTDRFRPWLLVPVAVAVWWLLRSRRNRSGSTPVSPPSGPPVEERQGSGLGQAAPLSTTGPSGPPAATTAAAESTTWGPYGMGPGRTWAPSTPPAPVVTRRRPGIGVPGVAAVLGLVVLSYGVAQASGATARPEALGLVCVVGTLGLALLVAGLLGRRASGLAALGVVAALAATVAVSVPSSVSWAAIGADGVGQAAWRPSPGAVGAPLRLGAGSATLDLGALGATTPDSPPVSASVRLGELVVVVPEGMTVEVDARVAAGEIVRRAESRDGATTFSRDGTNLRERVLVGSGSPTARVSADVGLGSLTIVDS